MNSSYEDLVGQVAAAADASAWNTTSALESLAAMAAYYEMKEQQRMPKTKPELEVPVDPHVFAGVNACTLAQLALQVKFGNPKSIRAQLTIAAANNVLRCWGLVLDDYEFEPVGDDDDPPAVAEEDPVLVWPPVDRGGRPLWTKIPDVYRENYYHVHEDIVVDNAHDPMSGTRVTPDEKLVLHEAYWNEESHTWRMRFSAPPQLAGLEKFWLSHSQVKAGDEIPPGPGEPPAP